MDVLNKNSEIVSPVESDSEMVSNNKETVIVIIPLSMKYKAIVNGTETGIKVPNTTKLKKLTRDFSNPVVVNPIKFGLAMNSDEVGIVKPDSIKIKTIDKYKKKVFVVPTTNIVIVRIPYTDKKIIERKNNASSIVDWSGYNNSDDGNCGTEVKHDIEPDL